MCYNTPSEKNWGIPHQIDGDDQLDKRNFKLIQGGKIEFSKAPGMSGKGKAFQQVKKNDIFLGAEVSATRLMGVVGLIMHYHETDGNKDYLFHLDFEEYGVDGYTCFTNEPAEFVANELLKVAGGLGGHMVSISEREAKALIYEAYQKDPHSVHVIYDVVSDKPELLSEVILSEVEKNDLYRLIGPSPQTDYELVNYTLMRMVGLDESALLQLSRVELPTAWYSEVSGPATLLKSSITQTNAPTVAGVKDLKAYQVEILVDYLDRYKIIHLYLEIALTAVGRRMVGIRLDNAMSISAYEASFQLRKREHIAVYEIMDEQFITSFEAAHPEWMKNIHGAGDLYTRFNPDNRHVGEKTYYLHGDVYANYYLTDEDQLVVSSFDLEHLDHIDTELATHEKVLKKIGEMTADQSILYEFVNSGYGNLYEYLEDTQG